jgi:hypothetical protein
VKPPSASVAAMRRLGIREVLDRYLLSDEVYNERGR